MNYLINEVIFYCDEDGSICSVIECHDLNADPVLLTPIPNRILSLLIKNQGQVVTYETFYVSVWDAYGKIGSSNSLKQNIGLIRKIFYGHFQCDCIVTVPGEGYCFSSDIKVMILANSELQLPVPSTEIEPQTLSRSIGKQAKILKILFSTLIITVTFISAFYIFKINKSPNHTPHRITSVGMCPVYSLMSSVSHESLQNHINDIKKIVDANEISCSDGVVFYYYSNYDKGNEDAGTYQALSRCPSFESNDNCLTYRVSK